MLEGLYDVRSGVPLDVVAEDGVELLFGVADSDRFLVLARGGGWVHSIFSIRWIGLRLDSIDCTGGAAYLLGIGGGLGGGDS